MIVVPFKAEHLDMIDLQDHQAGFSQQIADKSYGVSLERGSDSFTFVDDLKIIACCGIVTQWENRAVAWALMSRDAGKCMRGIVRAIDNYLKLKRIRRVEAFTTCDFKPGVRMLQILGFRCEGMAEKYTPDGHDCYLFARLGG